MNRVPVSVWMADYPFPTGDGREFLAPMHDLAESFNRSQNHAEVTISGVPFTDVPAHVREADPDTLPALTGYYAADAGEARAARDNRGCPVFQSIGEAIGVRRAILGEEVRLWHLLPAARCFYSNAGVPESLPWSVTTVVAYLNANSDTSWSPSSTWASLCGDWSPGDRPLLTFALQGWMLEQGLACQGEPLLNKGNGRGDRANDLADTPAALLTLFTDLKEMHSRGLLDVSSELEDWGGSFERFASQLVAVSLDSSKAAPYYAKIAKEVGFPLRVLPLPARSDHTADGAGSTLSGDSFWLKAGLEPDIRDSALAFSQFLLRPEHAETWTRAHAFTPVTIETFRRLEDSGWYREHPEQVPAWEALVSSPCTETTLGAVSTGLPRIYTALAEATRDVLDGASADDAYNSLRRHAVDILDPSAAYAVDTA